MLRSLRRLWPNEHGQDLVEYALLAALVALVIVASWDVIEGALGAMYRASGLDANSPHDEGLWQLFGGPRG